jgi:STE24 endopeptidase
VRLINVRKVLLGVGGGLAAGYAIVRAVEAGREWREPSPPVAKDARAYARARRALELADTLRSAVGLSAFAFGPLAKCLDRATSGVAPWLRPALYVAPLSVVSALVDFPAAYVQEYTLERRFGLSEQARSGWTGDYAKGALLSAGLLAIVSTLFGFAVRRAPRFWPLLASLGTFPLFVIGNLVVPLWVMPLFNEFTPVEGSLEERIRKLADRFGVGNAAILRIDMSRQTRKANAFVTGIGRTHRIVLGDTLIEAFPENETEFVVAHELGHYVNKDTWRLIALGELLAIVLFLIANAATPESRRKELQNSPLLIVRLYAIMIVATQALRPLLLAFSRSREWAADRFALAATLDAAAGASAFRRLRDQNLADEDPPSWYEFFFSSHPSLRARIDALQPDGG